LWLPDAEKGPMIDPQQRQLAQVRRLSCLECEREWTNPTERWRIYLTWEEPREPVLYCADCAAFEFDP
jgi:hypothetical protein